MVVSKIAIDQPKKNWSSSPVDMAATPATPAAPTTPAAPATPATPATPRDPKRRFGPAWFNKHGYINLSREKLDSLDADFWRLSSQKQARFPNPGPVHQVFRKECWVNITDDNYSAIESSLALASRLLEVPDVLDFFKGIFKRKKMAQFSKTVEKKAAEHLSGHQTLKQFRAVHMSSTDPSADAANVWKRMMRMARCHTWEFGVISDVDLILGYTGKIATRQGIYPDTLGTKAIIHEQFLDLLTGREKSSDVAQSIEPWQPGTDDESAFLRISLSFAITLVHEFCHALWFATCPIDPKTKLYDTVEPFYRDERIAELGWAWENYLFSGALVPVSIAREAFTITYPYGIGIAPRLGLSLDPEQAPIRGSFGKWGVEWRTTYWVHMDYVSSLYTKRFWDENVARNKFKPKRKIGIRYTSRGYDDDESQIVNNSLDLSPLSYASIESDMDSCGWVIRGKDPDVELAEKQAAKKAKRKAEEVEELRRKRRRLV